MQNTLINGHQARSILSSVFDTLFTKGTKRKILHFKNSFATNAAYKELHLTITAQVDEFVNTICSLGEPINSTKLDRIHQLLMQQPIGVQSYVFDRFFYASEQLAEIGPESLKGIHTEVQTLSYGLIHLWQTKEVKI